MMTLEERNRLAEAIVEQGGIWLLPFNGRKMEVTPVGAYKLFTGRAIVKVKAIKGKPFVQKDDYGEGRFITKTAYKNAFPEQLENTKGM